MKTANIKSANNNEKGIALIFSLIMLSLLLIMALSFALDSMFEQKAAYNSASASSAALTAKAQLNQILTLIENNQANFQASPSIASDRIFSYSSDSGVSGSGVNDMIRDRLTIPGAFEPLEPITTTDDFYNNIRWNYQTYNDGSTDKIVSRTAFILLSGLPLNSLISKTVDESGNTAAKTEKRIGKEVSEINVKDAMYQMHSVDTTSSTYTISSTQADVLNWQKDKPDVTSNRDAGRFTGIWPSFEILFNAISATGTSNNDIKFRRNFAANFAIDASKDKEAFWAEADGGNNEIESDELYKRFDLTRTDWSLSNYNDDYGFLKKIILLTNTGTALNTAMEKWDDKDSVGDTSATDYSSTVSKGLPWLACFGYKTDGTEDSTLAGTFPTVLARRFQIAANLKDYCDDDFNSDSSAHVIRPTSDVDPLTWYEPTSAVPTFTGNEKTPYINKMGVRVDVTREHYESAIYGTKTTYIKIYVTPLVGLIDIYGSTYGDLKVRISGSVTTAMSTDGGTNYDVVSPLSFDKELSFGNGDWSPTFTGHSTFKFSTSTGEGTPRSFPDHVLSTLVKVTNVTITKVVLYYEDTSGSPTVRRGYDYTKTITLTPDFTAFPNSNVASTQTSWFGFAVPDPRQNLNSGDWEPLIPLIASDPLGVFSLTYDSSVPAYYGAPNSQNTANGGGYNTEEPTAGPDVETATDPANGALSTAYIRNAPMESPWELGFIHRGAKWETINLKTYNASKAFQTVTINTKKYILGGSTYAEGDANILDQIKMTAKARCPQKINLLSQKKETFNALFSKIKLGCKIDSSMTTDSICGLSPVTGTEIVLSDSYYTTMRTAIMDWFKTPDLSGYTNLTRASIVGSTTTLVSGDTASPSVISLSTTNSDAAQEELIGKIINLTKIDTKVDNFTILVLTQTIKDVGGNGSDINITKTSADGSATQSVPCQLGRFDVVSPTGTSTLVSDWRQNVYGDEITGEQKILVSGYRDPWGNIKITSFQYLE